MPKRKFTQNNSNYRYGFNGQENSDEIAAGLTTAMYWEYDSRIARRWNVDPVVKFNESPYLCFSGNPIIISDINGDDGNDEIRGVNEESAKSTLSDINAGLDKIKNGDQFKQYFKIGTDGVTFEKIDEACLLETMNSNKLTAEESAFIKGYVKSINDDNLHFVLYINNKLDKTDFSKTKGISSLTISAFEAIRTNDYSGTGASPITNRTVKQSAIRIVKKLVINTGQFIPENKPFTVQTYMLLFH